MGIWGFFILSNSHAVVFKALKGTDKVSTCPTRSSKPRCVTTSSQEHRDFRQLQTAPQGKAPALPARSSPARPVPEGTCSPAPPAILHLLFLLLLLLPGSQRSTTGGPGPKLLAGGCRLRVAAPRQHHAHRERNSKNIHICIQVRIGARMRRVDACI